MASSSLQTIIFSNAIYVIFSQINASSIFSLDERTAILACYERRLFQIMRCQRQSLHQLPARRALIFRRLTMSMICAAKSSSADALSANAFLWEDYQRVASIAFSETGRAPAF